MNANIMDGILIEYRGDDPYIRIPDGVTEIANRAFYNCRAIREVTIPDSVKTIRSEAFMLCANLEPLVFSDLIISAAPIISP
ncbi:MAG: leucine-rich repeat protein [Anaerovoracaceae bacterium]|jgi:hypothetical protein